MDNYDLDAWNDPSRLPAGWAGGQYIWQAQPLSSTSANFNS